MNRFEIPEEKNVAFVEWLADHGFLERDDKDNEMIVIGAICTSASRLDGTVVHTFPKRVLKEIELPRDGREP